MVDIIFILLLVIDHDHSPNNMHNIPFSDRSVRNWDFP